MDKPTPTPPKERRTINELARVYSKQYASPHHMVFTLDGLLHLIAEYCAQNQQTQFKPVVFEPEDLPTIAAPLTDDSKEP